MTFDRKTVFVNDKSLSLFVWLSRKIRNLVLCSKYISHRFNEHPNEKLWSITHTNINHEINYSSTVCFHGVHPFDGFLSLIKARYIVTATVQRPNQANTKIIIIKFFFYSSPMKLWPEETFFSDFSEAKIKRIFFFFSTATYN